MPNCLTVDGLPHSFTDENLKALFESYGRVLRATMIHSHHISTYHYGLVEMATMEEAEQARLALNRARIDDHLILVFIATDEKGRLWQ